VTVDEEFNKLDDDLRRLKIEYEVYFNGGSPRPPHDTLYRVENTIKRYSSDQSKLNFSQRFRFTSLSQKYAVNSNLWRRKLQEREEGRSLTGTLKRPAELTVDDGTVRVICSDPDAEEEKVTRLLEAMKAAKLKVGDSVSGLDAAAFHKFIREKTRQIKETLGCDKVQFSVSVEDGKVKFKATKAE
jgi:putative ribosome biogenesis GTPase RsgA